MRVLSSYAVFLEEIHNNLTEADAVMLKIESLRVTGKSDEIVAAESKLFLRHGSVISGAGLIRKSKKQRNAFKEYRKQVFMYSRAVNAQLTWMVRCVLLVLFGAGIAQLILVVNIIDSLREYLVDLDLCA